MQHSYLFPLSVVSLFDVEVHIFESVSDSQLFCSSIRSSSATHVQMALEGDEMFTK